MQYIEVMACGLAELAFIIICIAIYSGSNRIASLTTELKTAQAELEEVKSYTVDRDMDIEKLKELLEKAEIFVSEKAHDFYKDLHKEVFCSECHGRENKHLPHCGIRQAQTLLPQIQEAIK